MAAEDQSVKDSGPNTSDDQYAPTPQNESAESGALANEKGLGTSTEEDFPDGGARAWLVAIGSSLVLMATFGYINSFGIYQAYYEANQLSGHSPSSISWIGSVQVFFVFGGALFGGPLFDRFGAKIIRPAAIVYVFSIMMTSLCTKYWQFMLAQGILGGISNGMTMAPSMAATSQYFNKKRGAAMGISIAGSSIGGVIFPIALGRMLDYTSLSFGWSVRIVGFLAFAILAFATMVIKARLPPRKDQFFLPRAFKNVTYDVLTAAVFLGFIGMLTPIFYLPVYAVSHDMSTLLAFYLAAILNGASFFGRVIPGILADKFGRCNSLAAALFSSGILSFCWTQCTTNASIIVFAAFFGFCTGAIISSAAVALVSCSEDPKNMGTYMGMGMGIASISALVGPPVNGAFLDHYGNFDAMAWFSGALCLAGGAAVIVAKSVSPQGVLALT
ncbi:major facilitator superfamily domain-containing protein [Lineolata rhizophorae]|uniref:Major facilitator superfamily domain-containing protein n=1 Tax=Lineolata rhizophorae TaxID=578093 RepID=A0A6A6P3X1_9PEZI|nr:major facilitator superfamily domain-containing protein [Lineolata rhizophorae]